MLLVVKMKDLFNMDEIPTLQAFSLTFHCDFLNLGVLTRKPILSALQSLQSHCKARTEEVQATLGSCLFFYLYLIFIYTTALPNFLGFLLWNQLGNQEGLWNPIASLALALPTGST